MLKLLIGGSPCTYWSIAQKNGRETEPKGLGWELFKNYLIAKEKFKPDYFLYENNKSATQAIKDQIKHELNVWDGTLFMEDSGARYIEINSALVSAQNRQRFYVHNCGEVGQPKDRGILLKDILETTTAEPVAVDLQVVGRKKNADGIYERSWEARTDGESSALTTVESRRMVAEPIRVGGLPRPNGELSTSQAMRVYSVDGKSVAQTANGGGMGAKTGLYAVPVENEGECAMFAHPHGWNEGMITYDKAQTLTTGSSTRQQNVLIQNYDEAKGIIKGEKPKAFIDKVYEVKDGQITIKGKQYPIKLADGYYIIRKLTVTECERLQTMPDGYTSKSGVSASQCYKGLGNGWTAEVIKHILSNALKDIPKDEEIVVLSMYDGIGTGRYCLDKMGFTNVKYFAYEIDKYAMQIAQSNYPDILEMGDAFQIRDDKWKLQQ